MSKISLVLLVGVIFFSSHANAAPELHAQYYCNDNHWLNFYVDYQEERATISYLRAGALLHYTSNYTDSRPETIRRQLQEIGLESDADIEELLELALQNRQNYIQDRLTKLIEEDAVLAACFKKE